MIRSILVFIFLSIFIIENKHVFSQTKRESIIYLYRNNDTLIKKLQFKDSISSRKYIQKKISSLQKKGFLLTSLDKHQVDKNGLLTYCIHQSERFKTAKIQIEAADIHFLKKKARLSEKYLANYPFSASEIGSLTKSIHSSLENNGYPFAAVQLDSVNFDGTILNAKLKIKKGPELSWTKIHIKGDDKISAKLISSYIQIKEGDLYNQELVQLISSRLSLLPFVQEIKPAELLFTPWGVELFLYLQTKKVSLANGVIGLQQKPNNTGYMLTGELQLKLVNELKRAETFHLNWKSIQYQTQSLNVILNTPNLFRTRFGLDGLFNLYKRDTSFLDLKFQIGVQYALNNGSYLKFYYRNESSSLLKGGMNNSVYTNYRDSKVNYYGATIFKQTIDYLPNPTKGYQLTVDAAIGQRRTKPKDSLNFEKTLTYKLSLNYQQFIRIYKRNVVRVGVIANYMGAPNYFQNEVYRFGGQIIQRGFNEEQLYATAFGTATIEYRYLVDRNSYAFAFYDQSYYQNKTLNNFQDTPLGFGAGFTFGTKIGSFSISYAMGKQRNSAINLKDGKVHFGYIAYF